VQGPAYQSKNRQ